jgi:hypothetical protein
MFVAYDEDMRKNHPISDLTSEQILELLESTQFKVMFIEYIENVFLWGIDLSVDLIKKIKEMTPNVIFAKPLIRDSVYVGLEGIMSNLRLMVLNDKTDIVEAIAIEFYDDFIKAIEKFGGSKFPDNAKSIFRELYIYYVTENLSDEFRLFLKLK